MTSVVPGLAGLVAFAIMAGLFWGGAHGTYNHLLTLWGIEPFRYPFVDLDGSLAAWDCARRGVDVIISDPCDVLARGYTYSPFWMTIDWIPLGRPDRVWVGLALGAAFLVSLFALPPALSPAETALRVTAVLSTMVAFAIERANPDLLIFLLALGGLALLRRSAIQRASGYGLFFLAGAIKYYPFVLLGLVARERPRLGMAIAAASLIGLGVFYSIYASQIHEGLPNIAKGGPFGDMFGASNLPVGIFMVLNGVSAPWVAPIQGVAVTITLVGATLFWVMLRVWRTSDLPAALGRIDEARRLALLAGALLLSGCFLAGQNVPYRGIFLFFVIPGLSALAQDRDAGAIASASRLTMIGIPILMWAEAIRLWIHLAVTGAYPPAGFHAVQSLDQPWDLMAWLGREVGWWFFIGFLLTILIGDLAIRPLRNGLRPFVLKRPAGP